MLKLRYGTPALPVELLDYIVTHLLFDKPHFAAINALSRASRLLREIAFRQFFSALFVTTKDQWRNMCRIPRMTCWVRALEATSKSLYARPSNLLDFPHLTSVSIDFDAEGLKMQKTSAKLILAHMPAQLKRLELLHLPSIPVYLLSLICDACPLLDALVLRCSDRLIAECCWSCYGAAADGTIHSPVPDHICNVSDFVKSYGAVLRPLTKLSYLHLGIFLSPQDLFTAHLEHVVVPTDIREQPYGPDLCSLCEEHADEIRETELAAAAAIAGYLPRLEAVTWSSWFARAEPGDDFRERSTTAWVLRDEQGVLVRRAPW